MPLRRHRGGGVDRGSASIWVLMCCAVLVVIGAVVTVRTSAVLLRHRAEAAADLAALAAAGRIGIGTDECPAAAAVAVANGGTLQTCELRLGPDGRSGAVSVRVVMSARLPVVGARHVIATARAGRDPPLPPSMPSRPGAGRYRGPRFGLTTPARPPRRDSAMHERGTGLWHDEARSAGATPRRPDRARSSNDDTVGGRVDLTVTREGQADRAVVAVRGEIDVSSAPELQQRLLQLVADGAVQLVVDLAAVGFLDSTGLGALVAGRAAAVDAGGALAIACDQERIVKLFTITGLDSAFPIGATVDAASAALPASGS